MRPAISIVAPFAIVLQMVCCQAIAQPAPDKRSTLQDSGPHQESPKGPQGIVPPMDPSKHPKGVDNKPLSEKLKDGEGVLAPPAVGDPDIRKPAPAMPGNQMPVIVPPGEPGGDPSVQPR